MRRIGESLAACGVEPDQVALNGVPVRRGLDEDATLGVAGNDVALTGRRAADGVAGRPGLHRDAAVRIADGAGAGGVQADVVPADQVTGRRGAGDADAGVVVAGDQVCRNEGSGHTIEVDAVGGVAQIQRARRVGPDEVALDRGVVGATRHNDTDPVVAGNDVAHAGREPPIVLPVALSLIWDPEAVEDRSPCRRR